MNRLVLPRCSIVKKPVLDFSVEEGKRNPRGVARRVSASAFLRGELKEDSVNAQRAAARAKESGTDVELFERYSLKGRIHIEVSQACGLLLDEYA